MERSDLPVTEKDNTEIGPPDLGNYREYSGKLKSILNSAVNNLRVTLFTKEHLYNYRQMHYRKLAERVKTIYLLEVGNAPEAKLEAS